MSTRSNEASCEKPLHKEGNFKGVQARGRTLLETNVIHNRCGVSMHWQWLPVIGIHLYIEVTRE
jgi:hypothetical protein